MSRLQKGIHATSLIKQFGTPPTQVLKSVTLTIEPGEFVSITGRSGSGKSTLLYILSTLDHASSGELEIEGRLIQAYSEPELHRFRNLQVGFVFQFHYLLPELNALENVMLPARKAGETETRRDRALELLKTFDLGDKAHRFPGQLSGGEQQRVAIARALVMDPAILFADEPTGNLDTVNGESVIQILENINRTQGTAIVMVTHDPGFAARAHRQIHLVDGQIQAK